jgi:chromate transporter
MTTTATTIPSGRISELVRYFLRLGFLGFGGPVALVGQMERELVDERKWLTKEQMRESIAICQSLPGPLAIQVGIYVSYLRGGFWGAWAGGWAFILPNFVIVAALGALYVYLGDLQPVTAIFYGVSPAVIALILHSCYRLAKLGMEDWLQWVIAAVCLAVTVILQAEVALLFIGAGIVGILYYGSLFKRTPPAALSVTVVPVLAQLAPTASGSILGKLWRLAGSTPVPDRCCHRHDQPGTGCDHRDLCRLSRRRILGGGRLDDRYFPSIVSVGADRCTTAGAPSW